MNRNSSSELAENYDVQKKHYDLQAISESVADIAWELDSSSVRHCLQAPYEFCVSWFSKTNLSGKKVLDYGCGAKALSIYIFRKSGAYVYGVDISPESIKVAKKKAEYNGVQGMTSFEVGNCESLSYNDSSFDFIFSAGTMSAIDLNRGLSEMARVVKVDGTVLIVDTLGHNPVLNLSRRLKLKRGIKTRWSVDHILTEDDLKVVGRYFQKVSLYYFDLTTLLLVPLAYLLGSTLALPVKIARGIDRYLLSVSLLSKHAFKVVCILSKPYKHN